MYSVTSHRCSRLRACVCRRAAGGGFYLNLSPMEARRFGWLRLSSLQQLLGGAAVGVGTYRGFTSTSKTLLPSLHHCCPPLHKERYETPSTVCFDSYERGHESLPPRLEKVTAELRLCHRRPISDCTDSASQAEALQQDEYSGVLWADL